MLQMLPGLLLGKNMAPFLRWFIDNIDDVWKNS